MGHTEGADAQGITMMRSPRPQGWIVPWPDGRPRPNAPRAAIWLAELASQLVDHDPDEIAAAADLHRETVDAVVDGAFWPSLHIVTALITALEEAGRPLDE